MLDALREDGQPEESGWPYLATTPADAGSWAPPAEIGTLFGRNGEKSSPSLDRVIHELDQGRPVIVLLILSRAFYGPTSQGVVDPAVGEAPGTGASPCRHCGRTRDRRQAARDPDSQ